MAVKRLQLSVNAACDVLITNALGKRLGFDAQSGQVFEEIPQAEMRMTLPFPLYLLPADDADKPYRISLSGKAASRELRADLTISGGGFVAGCKDLRLSAGDQLLITITSDGRRLALTAGHSSQSPLLYTATQSGRSMPSYLFEIGGPQLASGKTLAVALDLQSQRLTFKDDNAKRDKYTVKIRRTNPDGTRNVFFREGILFGMADHYLVDFGKRDNKPDVCLYVADKADHFDDKSCIEISLQR